MTPRKWLDWYERGMLTAFEFANRLCEWDRVTDPTEFADDLPEAVLALVRERVEDIPKPEDVFPIGRLGSPGPVRGSPEYRAEQERCLAGMRLWKAYFDAQATQG